MSIEAVNPATGETIRQYEEFTSEEVRGIIEQAHEAFLSWGSTSFAERAKLMKSAAQVLRDDKEEFATLMALEMGKPITAGRSEAARWKRLLRIRWSGPSLSPAA